MTLHHPMAGVRGRESDGGVRGAGFERCAGGLGSAGSFRVARSLQAGRAAGLPAALTTFSAPVSMIVMTIYSFRRLLVVGGPLLGAVMSLVAAPVDDRLTGDLGKAWEILNAGQHAKAVGFVDDVMETIHDEAVAEARRMKGFAPAGRERDYHRVNVAGTLLYVRALGLQRDGQSDAWLAGLERCWKEYPFAQAWDPQGWYWKPAQAAKKEAFIEKLTAAIRDRKLDASPFPEVEDALDYPQMSIALASVSSGMLERGEYQNLEYLAGRLRDQKLKFPDGNWLLPVFYRATAGAAGPGGDPASWERTRGRLAKWLEEAPGSVTAQIAEAKRLVSHAWEVRGSGVASEVKPEVWPVFNERIEAARAVLDSAPRTCPEWFHQRLVVARAQGDDLAAQQIHFEAAWKAFPEYLPTVQAMVYNLLPRWCGQAGQWQRLARWLNERDGAALYASAINEAWRYERAEILEQPGIDRALFRQGWKALLSEHAGSLILAHEAIVVGLSIKDQQITAMGFEAAGERSHPSYWATAADFLAARKKAVAPTAKD